jgi:hypothetical protein
LRVETAGQGTDPCVTGSAADEIAAELLNQAPELHHHSITANAAVVRQEEEEEEEEEERVATPLVSERLNLGEASGSGGEIPPLSQQCLADTEKLLGSQMFMQAYEALVEAADILIFNPLLEKCGSDLALTGACKGTADFSQVATQLAAADAAASAVSTAATVCKFDATYYGLNKDVQAKHPLWKVAVEGGRVLWCGVRCFLFGSRLD